MNKEDCKILLMDDEVEDTSQAQLAYEELEKAGYQVDKCQKMSTVLNNYQEEFYHLYILDIDMQKVEDVIEGTGMTVGETLKKLSSLSEILVYSALGTVDDWFEAANYQFRGYVRKQDGVKELLTAVEKICDNYDPQNDFSLSTTQPEDKALVYYREAEDYLSYSKIENILKQNEIKEIDKVSKLGTVINKLASNDYQVVLLAADNFSTRSSTQNKLAEIIAVQPQPQVIVSLYGTESRVNNILAVTNLTPFRFLNLEWINYISRLEEAVESAIKWYGREEIFEFPEDDSLVPEADFAEIEEADNDE